MGTAGSGKLIALQLAPRTLAASIAEAWGRGDAVLPLPPRLPSRELRDVLEELRPDGLLTEAGFESLPRGRPVPGDVSAVVRTSGSFGRPRGVELSGRALEASASAGHARLGAVRGQRWLCPVPLHHVAGLVILVRSAQLGTEPVLLEGIDEGSLEEVEPLADFVSLVPTMLARLLRGGADLSGFRAILVGGGPLPVRVGERARDSGARIVETYGATETCGGCVYDGIPLDGVEVDLGAGGEVLVRGAVLGSGYRNRPDLTARAFRDGWWHSADAGAWAPDGRLVVLGRLDDAIVSGGELVWPAEVESRLEEHPAVTEAVVTGRPDDEWGERVVALMVPAATRCPPAAELQLWLKERLAGFKVPREIVFVDAIPRLPSGKPDRARIIRDLEVLE